MTPSDARSPFREREFTDALRHAAGLAALSPSSHNCQPWALARLESRPARRAAADLLGTPDDDGHVYLALALDLRRQLTTLPGHFVEMRVSCAAYWRMLTRALAAQGWTTVAGRAHEGRDLLPARAPVRSWPQDWSLLWTAALRRGGGPAESLTAFRVAAHARHTNRGPYEAAPLPAPLLGELARPRPDADAGAVEVRHLASAAEREAVAGFLARHGGIDYSHPAAWRETHAFIRWSPAAVRAHGDGFPAPLLFGPLTRARTVARRIALAPPVMRLLCRFGYDRSLAAGLAETVRQGPAVVAMSFPQGPPGVADAFAGGARIADYWLGAARAGLALHPVSVLMQHDELRRALQAELGISGQLFFLSRVGRPLTAYPRSPRRADAAACRTV
ncbi:RedV protein [Streptomyces gamaensis]|uniref:RedV protein n=1 Tax=Streptomyces gamaensis TaxID=1763542 RepID=A0ABW0YTQ4_9ACTN